MTELGMDMEEVACGRSTGREGGSLGDPRLQTGSSQRPIPYELASQWNDQKEVIQLFSANPVLEGDLK